MRSNYVAAPESASSSLNLLTGSPYSQSGGRSKRRSKSMGRSKSKARRARRAGSSCSMTKSGGSNRRSAKGGMMSLGLGSVIQEALVPFGIFAWQKRTQRNMSRKHKKGKTYRRR